MTYRIAAIDVHKKMLAVVVADVAGEDEYEFERRKFGATPDQLHLLAQWLVEQEVEEVVMESRSTGSRYGGRWSGTGSRRARSGTGRPRCPAHCICARPNPTAGRAGGRMISATANG